MDGRFIACRHICQQCCQHGVDAPQPLADMLWRARWLLEHSARTDWSFWTDAEGARLEREWRAAGAAAINLPSTRSLQDVGTVSCDELGFRQPQPFEQRPPGWRCTPECDYRCAVQNRDVRIRHGEAVVQYWGRWPFERVGGMSEPGSALASLLNLAWPLLFLMRGSLRRRTAGSTTPKLAARPRLFTWNAMQACLAWGGSFAYHALGTDFASRVDLSLALATTVSNTHLILVLNGFERRIQASALLAILVAMLAWLCHIWRAPSSPVGQSVAACVVVYLPSVPLSLRWATRERERRPHAWLLPFSALGVAPCFLLELVDFPPILHHTVDAHACWHGCTVPLYAAFYEFLRREELFRSRRAE